MKIGLVGGVYGKSTSWQEEMQSAPEKTLQYGLSERGHTVVTGSLNDEPPADCDIVHCHQFGYASMQSSTTETPFVFTSHNPFLASSFCNSQFLSLLPIGMILLNRADFVVALSHRERTMFIHRFGVPSERIEVIPNGFRPELYAIPEGELNGGFESPRLLCVAQLEKFKGIKYLLLAMKNVAEVERTIQLEIVSQNRRRLAEYERLCAEYGVGSRVRFLGPLTMHELVKAYHRCTIYVHPSLAEDLPISISEAMMCGKPIVATSVGGICEQINEEVGILIEPKSPDSIATAILHLLNDHNLIDEMGKKARRRALSLYDYKSMCENHESLYRKALESERQIPRGSRIESKVYRMTRMLMMTRKGQ